MFLLFPVPAQVFRHDHRRDGVPRRSAEPRVANAAHLGGLIFRLLVLQGGRGGLTAEIKYRYLKWKMNRLRRKFDVYSGGRSDWDGTVH